MFKKKEKKKEREIRLNRALFFQEIVRPWLRK